MSKLVLNKGGNDTLVLKGTDVSGIRIVGDLYGATNNVAITKPAIDLSEIRCEVKLHQAGKVVTILPNHKLLPVLMGQSYWSAAWEGTSPNSANLSHYTTKAEGASNVEEATASYELDFGGVINLRGNDRIEVKIDISSSVFDATVDGNTSTISFEDIKGVGLQYSVPMFALHSIKGSETETSKEIGDNVQEVIYINTDVTDLTTANAPVVSYSFRSDRLTEDKDYADMLADRTKQFESFAQASDRDQCFSIYNGTDCDNVNIDLVFESANITSGANFLYVKKFYVSGGMIAKADKRKQKHVAKLQRKVR